MTVHKRLGLAIVAGVMLASVAAHAQSPPVAPVQVALSHDASSDTAANGASTESASDLAKKLQNPIGDLINVPFQNNTNFNVGPNKGTQDILNI
jgi:hypothetical protein